ncbi:MAG: YlxR family protein [Acidimicrobiales bacterium]
MGCRRRGEMGELMRVFATDQGPALGKGPGRGAWLHATSRECFERASLRKAFAVALRRPISTAWLEAACARLFEGTT